MNSEANILIPGHFAVLSELPGVSDSRRGMKGSGTARSGGLESRISFVFSAGGAAMDTLKRAEGTKEGGTGKEREREGQAELRSTFIN